MIVNTQRLFPKLLARLQIGVVCDVGSMNGADALVFRDAVPESRIYAFEPNPHNVCLMQASSTLKARRIQIVPLAVTNYDGEAEFFITDADYSRLDFRRGMSSLYQRFDKWAPAAVVPVRTTRLDTYLAHKCAPDARLALWIDTEGKAHEAIEGIVGIADRVHLLHVEVETSPFIGGIGQKLYSDVKVLLRHLGFVEFATDQARRKIQFNVLFVRSDLSGLMMLRVRSWQVRAMLRYLLVSSIRAICPACLRRYQAMRNAR